MRCPHCNEVLASMICESCGGETPEGSNFCYICGNPVKKEIPKVDFSERTPCKDGNCIGTINEEGVCSICKKPYH